MTMFYGQCWKCGERWGLGTASTCKCPDEEPVKFAFKENNDSTEVLRVTPEGEFIWNPDADKLIAEGDFSQSLALPHILKALRKQRTQPEQEPVAWADMDVRGEDKGLSWTPGHFHKTPLYTSPPAQRPWVGLTNDEIRALASWWPSYDQMPALMVLAKEIQENLKERNNG